MESLRVALTRPTSLFKGGNDAGDWGIVQAPSNRVIPHGVGKCQKAPL